MKKSLIIPLLFIAIVAMAESVLIVQPLTGYEQTSALSQIGYLKVTQDSLFIYSHNGFLLSNIAIEDIRSIRFGEPNDVTSIDNVQSVNTCHVYPNPTQDMLIIDNTDCSKAYLFDINGQLLQQFVLNKDGSTAIDVSYLLQGTYILLLNTQPFKFIKQ